MDDLENDLEDTNPFSQQQFNDIKNDDNNHSNNNESSPNGININGNNNYNNNNDTGNDNLDKDFNSGFFSGAGKLDNDTGIDIDKPNKGIYDDNNNDMDFVNMNSGNAYDDDLEGKISSNNEPIMINNNNNNNNNNKSKKSKKKKKKNNPFWKQSNNNRALTHEQLDEREAELKRREKELQLRRERLDNKKIELTSDNIRKDNWPSSCYPITFHSIKQEIPPHARPHMKKMYAVVLFTFLTMFWNFCAQLALYFGSVGNNFDRSMLLSVAYLIIGSAGAWKCWYRQIYYGIRDRLTVKWWIFFVFYVAHIGFCIVMCIGIQGIGAAGFSIMITAFNSQKGGTGMCCLISAIFWFLLSIASMFQLKKSWNLYKDRGGLEQAQEEFTKAALRHAADQMV